MHSAVSMGKPGCRALVWSLAPFVVGLILLSIPFWMLGWMAHAHLLPGVPLSGLMFVVPGTCALLWVLRRRGPAGAARWLRQALRCPVAGPRHWLWIAVALPAMLMLVSGAAMVLRGDDLPAPGMGCLRAVGLLPVLLLPALCEELGWSHFAVRRLRRSVSLLSASVMVGLVWAAWHLVPLMQAGRSAEWIAWWTVVTVTSRVLISWLCARSGPGILAAIAFHASGNAAWQAFPVQGSRYDQQVHAIVLSLVCGLVLGRYGRSLRPDATAG